MRVALRRLSVVLVALAVAPAARAQTSVAVDFLPPLPPGDPPAVWHLEPHDNPFSEFESIRAQGPLFADGRALDICQVIAQLGVPAVQADFDSDPRVVELVFGSLAGAGGCPDPTLVSRVEVLIGVLPEGSYEFRYQQGGLGISLPFEVVAPPPSDLASGRVTFDAVGDEAEDLAPTVAAGNFAWTAFTVLGSEIRLVVDGAERQERVPQSETVVNVPRVSENGLVVWDGQGQPDFDVFVSDGIDPVNVSDGAVDNLRDDLLARISGSIVVWQSSDPEADDPESSLEIYYADVSSFPDAPAPIRITNNAVVDRNPEVSGTRVVWENFDADADACDATTGFCVDSVDDQGNPLACTSDADCGDFDIVYVDLGQTPTPCDALPCASASIEDFSDAVDDRRPMISGGLVVWQRREPTGMQPSEGGPDLEVFYADLSGAAAAQQLTDTDYDDANPFISGARVVWEGSVPDASGTSDTSFRANDPEIFFASGLPTPGTPAPLTDNDTVDLNPKVRGPVAGDSRVGVFWETDLGGGRRRVLTTDASAPGPPVPVSVRLSGDLVAPQSLQVSDALVLWSEQVDDEPAGEGSGPQPNFEIFSSPQVVVPEPGALVLRAAALLALALLASLRRRAVSGP